MAASGTGFGPQRGAINGAVSRMIPGCKWGI